MNEFLVNVTVEVDQVGNGLSIQTPVHLQIGHNAGRWRVRCALPSFETVSLDTMDSAIVAGARQAKAELQGAVIERPFIVGRITPEAVAAMW
jgi:hypothetical protein